LQQAIRSDLQKKEKNPGFVPKLIDGPEDIVIAYVVMHCEDDCIEGEFCVMDLVDILPKAPEYLLPIKSDELKVGQEEMEADPTSGGKFRTRTIVYSGWGANDFPLITVPEPFRTANPGLKSLYYGLSNDANVLLAPNSRTLAIDGRKFDDTDPTTPQMLVNTAEEWAVYNSSLMLWANTDSKEYVQPGQYKGHYVSYPISRYDGQTRFKNDPKKQFQITTLGVDHPFHIHTNPTWVMRIEIPDEHGNLVNILPEPRWQDVIWLPRGGGRVVFRSRFAGYTGRYVNHCHILLHEDNGMMQVVEVTNDFEKVNYKLKTDGAFFAAGRSLQEVNELYPKPTLEDHYISSIKFVDPNDVTGQVYPSFSIKPPTLP
jgi:hypothetical protein